MLVRPAFSPSLAHVVAHPPVLLTHLAVAFFAPPPPASPPGKFWNIFLPFSERGYETDRLVFGPHGEGSSSNAEIAVEIVVRGADSSKRRRATDRTLEGWCAARGGACQLTELESLKSIFEKKAATEEVADVLTMSEHPH
jgi:elongator complex protein 5